MCGVWVESVDPVVDLCRQINFCTEQFNPVQSGTADREQPLNSRYEEITVMTDTSHTKYILIGKYLPLLLLQQIVSSSISSSCLWLQEFPM